MAVAGFVAYRFYATRASYLLRQGQAALERGDWDEAQRQAERLEKRGHVQEAHLIRGEAWLREGRALQGKAEQAASLKQALRARLQAQAQNAFRNALKELSQIRDEGAVTLPGTVQAAECLYHLNEKRLAADVLTAVVKRRPDDRDAHHWLAAIYFDLNSPLDAVEHLKEWGRLDPDNGVPYRWIAFFYKDYNRPAQAIEAYREAWRRTLAPDLRVAVVREWAETLIAAQADYLAALDVLNQCPEEARQSSRMLVLRAECLLWGRGQHEEASRLLDQALQADPDLVEALLLRARLFLDHDQPHQAVTLLEKAVRLDPHEVKCRQALMEACRRVGDLGQADKHQRLLEELRADRERLSKLHQAAIASPWDDAVRYEIGILCRKLNRTQEARTWFQAALTCNPGNRKVQQALAEMSNPAGVRTNAVPIP
jgi:tetratricopeptide (TPR) repeat protein